MKKKSLTKHICSTARTIDILGDQWSLMILRDAFYGFSRFSEFQARLDIPKTTLSARLDHLVEHNILRKEADPESPTRFHYLLTVKGRDLFPVIVAIMQWGDRWIFGPENQPILLLDRKDHAPLKTLVVESESGELLGPKDVTFVAGPGANEEVQSFANQRGHNSVRDTLIQQRRLNEKQ